MRNTFKLILFIIVFIFIFYSFESIFQINNADSNWRKFENIERNSLDLVIFGNSHAVNTYHQFLLDDLLSINSLVIGEGGVSFPLFYYELLRVLERQSPKYVIVETYTFDTPILENRYINYLREAKINKFDFGVLLHFFDPNNYWWISEFAINHTRIYKEPNTIIDNTYQYLKTKKTSNEEKEKISWFYSLDKVIDENKNTESYLIKRPVLDEKTEQQYIKYLYKLKKLCDKNDIQLIFVRSPMQSIDLEKPVNYVSNFSETNQILIDNIDEKIQLSQIDFFNENHVSTSGSYKSTLELSRFLANETLLSLNEDVYDIYSNLLFDDFNYSKTNDYLFFELIRENDSYSDLNFSWNIFGENETLDMITSVPEIEIKNRNVESLTVKIFSRDIEYPLILEFDFPLR